MIIKQYGLNDGFVKCKSKTNICLAYIQINVLLLPDHRSESVHESVEARTRATDVRSDTSAVVSMGRGVRVRVDGTRVNGVDTLCAHRTVPPHRITGL